MIEKPVTFKVKGKQIVGMIHLPNKKNLAVIIMCHGWATGKLGNDHFLFVKAARYFCKKGFAILRFDHRGVGDSEGDFEDHTTSSSLVDIQGAIGFIEKFRGLDKSKIGLVGQSMGGTNAIITAARDKRVKCVVSWAGAADYDKMAGYWLKQEIMKRGYVMFWGFKSTKKSLIDDSKWSALKFVGKVSVPILIVNGDRDDTVYPVQAEALYKNAKQPKKLLMIKGADHGFSGEEHQKILFENTVKWLKRWLK